MSRIQRITGALKGFFFLAASTFVLLMRRDGFYVVLFLISLSLVLAGIRYLSYFISMARYMTGGWRILLQGFIALDMGLFSLSISSIHPRYIMLYLIGVNLFNALVDILRALESKKMEAPGWKLSVAAGAFEIFLSVMGVFFLDSLWLASLLYCVGLIYSGLYCVARAFSRTDVIALHS